MLTIILVWAYRRLRRAQEQLADRTGRLLRANHELSLAAKTSALGSVTAHLIHGLSNPLANLQQLVTAHNGSPPSEIETVAVATRRMRQLVDDVVRVLGEERVGERYELTIEEMAEVLRQKLSPAAEMAGVPLEIRAQVKATVNNRTANLTLLILENLVHNALRVSPAGRVVRVDVRRELEGALCCTVSDEGPGVPPEIVAQLFQPCRSTHGGSGLGLAISRQLAAQLGADLSLTKNSGSGCIFTLRFPPEQFGNSEAERGIRVHTSNPNTGS
jgi:signal transduction histidine kinase